MGTILVNDDSVNIVCVQLYDILLECIMNCICLQDKEANLDITMDRMRQDASEASLQESLKKAIDMLTKIKEGWVWLLVHNYHLYLAGIT